MLEKFGLSHNLLFMMSLSGSTVVIADAEAVLRGMNALFGLGCSVEELKKLGVTLGADIPYCIEGGTMLSEGIGEILTPLSPPPPCHLVVAKPDIDVSTAFVYGHLQADMKR